METILDNRVIGKFMGYDIEEVNNSTYFTKSDMLESLSDEEVHYHSSWDWLMEVVIKINTIDDYRYTVMIQSMDVVVYDNIKGANIFESGCDWSCDELIHSVYEAVVAFIKWHNNK